jgi:hypothetical protein
MRQSSETLGPDFVVLYACYGLRLRYLAWGSLRPGRVACTASRPL